MTDTDREARLDAALLDEYRTKILPHLREVAQHYRASVHDAEHEMRQADADLAAAQRLVRLVTDRALDARTALDEARVDAVNANRDLRDAERTVAATDAAEA